MMGWNDGGMGPLAGLATGVFLVVLLALIVCLLARRLPGDSKTTRPAGESPVETLDGRLARGEIAWRLAGATGCPHGSR